MSYRLEQQVMSATIVGPDLCWLFVILNKRPGVLIQVHEVNLT